MKLRIRIRKVLYFLLVIGMILEFCLFVNNYDSRVDKIGHSSLSIGYYLEPCNCTKYKKSTSKNFAHGHASSKSHCGKEADWKGNGQRVISYTLYNNSKVKGHGDGMEVYMNGILKNVGQMKKLYPGWSMRIYSNAQLNLITCKFACLDEITWCDVSDAGASFHFHSLENVNPRLWRFLPLGDPTVKIFLSRDLDSWLLKRETEVVSEWLDSNLTFHSARDGPNIINPIQAGCWGVKNYDIEAKESLKLLQTFLMRGMGNVETGLDEKLLHELVYEKYPHRILIHASYHCTKNYSVNVIVPTVPFPKRRKRRDIYFAKDIFHWTDWDVPPCPIECRPTHGKLWTFC